MASQPTAPMTPARTLLYLAKSSHSRSRRTGPRTASNSVSFSSGHHHLDLSEILSPMAFEAGHISDYIGSEPVFIVTLFARKSICCVRKTCACP